MSHITTVDVAVVDLDALELACEDCGVKFVRNAKRFVYYAGNTEPCDHLIRGGDGMYEVGVVAADDVYRLKCDNYAGGNGMVQLVGQNCGKLLTSYGRRVTMQKANAMGRPFREYEQNGKLVMEIL